MGQLVRIWTLSSWVWRLALQLMPPSHAGATPGPAGQCWCLPWPFPGPTPGTGIQAQGPVLHAGRTPASSQNPKIRVKHRPALGPTAASLLVWSGSP